MTGRPSLHLIELTDREAELITHYALGKQQRQIAKEMGVTENTVKSLTKSAFERLGAVNNANAVALAISLGLLPADIATR
ncbi:response regulator transcription factor [Kitasatospora mediocidica]|uniref:response regulator transcription factor n=1 Tax=Kitasatospora mediocidica TaxID=58352 RepID=UPI00068EB0B5|nr:LuxR C-terminal-related transcriptional regulator [Kitasatospora mediocidica]